MEHVACKARTKHDWKNSRCRGFLVSLFISVPICSMFGPYRLNLELFTGHRHNMFMGTTKKITEAPYLPLYNVSGLEPRCNYLGWLSDYCEMEGDIRVEAKSSTIFLVSPSGHVPTKKNNVSWSIRPYARKDNLWIMTRVKKWTIKSVESDHGENIPNCSKNHNIPAILFSSRGFTMNTFHAFSDLLIPIFATSHQFKGKVQFLVTEYEEWLISKYKLLFSNLSKRLIIPIDMENKIHCFPKLILGTKSHRDMGIKSSEFPDSLSMDDFRKFMRSIYSLNRTKAIRLTKGDGKRPRLMVLSRKGTRKFTNLDQIRQVAEKLGYTVIISEVSYSTNITSYSQLVNSCDVLMGVHGAGLTSLVYLPDNAIFIQIIPFGVDFLAIRYYGRAMKHMSLNYVEYKIKLTESTLIEQYPLDHQVIKDPESVLIQGWGVHKSIYMNNQDVRIDLRRLRLTLEKSIKILRGEM